MSTNPTTCEVSFEKGYILFSSSCNLKFISPKSIIFWCSFGVMFLLIQTKWVFLFSFLIIFSFSIFNIKDNWLANFALFLILFGFVDKEFDLTVVANKLPFMSKILPLNEVYCNTSLNSILLEKSITSVIL